MSNKVHHI